MTGPRQGFLLGTRRLPLRMFRFAVLCFVVGACTCQKAIRFVQCPDGGGDAIKEVRVTPCSEEPCKFQRGTTVMIDVDFVANSGVENPRIQVSAKVGPLELTLPGLKPDACQDYNLQCPLRKGNAYTFKHHMNVLPIYPKVSTTTTYKLTGGEHGTIFCFKAPVEIVDKE